MNFVQAEQLRVACATALDRSLPLRTVKLSNGRIDRQLDIVTTLLLNPIAKGPKPVFVVGHTVVAQCEESAFDDGMTYWQVPVVPALVTVAMAKTRMYVLNFSGDVYAQGYKIECATVCSRLTMAPEMITIKPNAYWPRGAIGNVDGIQSMQ